MCYGQGGVCKISTSKGISSAELIDAYDNQTLTSLEGMYYDGNENLEEVAVNMLYNMIKNPIWYDCNKQMETIKILLFLEWNNTLFINGEQRKTKWNRSITHSYKT